jgi:hypothetical protein
MVPGLADVRITDCGTAGQAGTFRMSAPAMARRLLPVSATLGQLTGPRDSLPSAGPVQAPDLPAVAACAHASVPGRSDRSAWLGSPPARRRC